MVLVALIPFAGTAPSFGSPTDGRASQVLSITSLDLVIIVLYFLTVLGIGFYLRKYTKTGEEFFMAGRKITAWIAGLSFISANLSSLETMGWSAMAYQYGMLGAHAYLIGAIPAILFLAVVMMPFYYISRTHSVPGYLKLRYGEASRSLAGISFSFMTVLVCGVNMFAMAKVMQLLLGWNFDLCIWVSSLTVAVYVALGGLLSAVFNEVLQYFLIWLGTLLVPILGMIEAGGWSKMLASINAQHPGQNFTSLWSNLGSAADNPMGMHWTGMVFGLGIAVSFGYWCTDFLQVQRVMAAKSLRTAQNGTVIGAVLKMLVPIIVTIPGLLGLAVLTQKEGITLVPESVAQATGGHSFNEVLPLMMARYLGPGLLGLGVTAMIAGFMSGMAGNVSAFSTVWTYDVYRPLIRKNATDAHYVSMGRWSSIVGVFIAIMTAYAAKFFSNILVYLQVLVMFFIIPLFGVVILGMLWKRATAAGGFWGFLAGILTSVGEFVYVHVFPGSFDAAHLNPDHVQHIALSPLAQDMAVNMYSAFWSLLVSMGITVLVSVFTKPKTREELKDLVYGLTKIPDEGPTPWYKHPNFWAAIVFCVLVGVNILFW
ncbi:MAG TPA: sodium:solute symporter family protein [Bacteroidota bacterium]|nr:sodium:solute symporter family protein [Bacteroidota bacterium]